jgi:hypothetical protein
MVQIKLLPRANILHLRIRNGGSGETQPAPLKEHL